MNSKITLAAVTLGLALVAGLAYAKQHHSGIVTNANQITTTPLNSTTLDGEDGTVTPPVTLSPSISCSPSCGPSTTTTGGSASVSTTLTVSTSNCSGSCSYSWSYSGSLGSPSAPSNNKRTWSLTSYNGSASISGTVTVTATDSAGNRGTTSRAITLSATQVDWVPEVQTVTTNCSYPQRTCEFGSDKRTETSDGVWGPWVTVTSPLCVGEKQACP
ncbi:hypothetical protein [Ferrimonas marina]|uniref:Ig-like domain-containing protein n=1 Tax=Ferrimonas marina TaxID=299255 RepID=A0A1M5UE54_9GAMM|nr:hypothetical protein [Ferrimonas marina]SHH61239.1 hypothetical protein SAMN02745129_2524 [Ferrimonas marina]